MLKLIARTGAEAGTGFPLWEGENTLGRSSKSDLRVMSGDVSRHHARLVVHGATVMVEGLGRHGTFVGDRRLEDNAPAALAVGQRLRLGKRTEFILEEAPGEPLPEQREMTAASRRRQDARATGAPATMQGDAPSREGPASADPGATDSQTAAAPESTVDPQAPLSYEPPEPKTGFPDDGATQQQMTRVASMPELADLRLQDQRKVRTRHRAVGALIVASGLALLFYPKPRPETMIVWDDRYPDMTLDTPLGGGLKLFFPKAPGLKIEQPPSGEITITCRLGAKADVPLRLTLVERLDDRYAGMDGPDVVAEWIARMGDENKGWSFGKPFPSLVGDDSGFRIWAVPYDRFDSESWSGMASLFRNGRRLDVLRVEIPKRDRWRAESFLYNAYLEAGKEYVRSCWEGRRLTTSAPMKEVLSEVRTELRREAPETWASCEDQLTDVLVRSVAEKKDAEEKDALGLLVTLRDRQEKWFNTQCLLVEQAKRRLDRERVNEIAGFNKVVFPVATDPRYYTVRKWQLR